MTERKPLTWHNETDRILGTVAVAHANDGSPEHWQEREQTLQDLMHSTEEGLLRRVHLSHEDVAGRYLDGQWEEES